MKIFTYKKDEEELVLVFEEILDENNNLIYYKDYQADPITEKFITYNSSFNIEREVEIADGKEINKQEFVYDENGNNIERRLFIGGELYEILKTEYTEEGTILTTIRENEEVEKIETIENGDNYIKKFYENGELNEIQDCQFETENNLYLSKFYNSENELLGSRIEKLNSSGELIQLKELNASDNLIEEDTFEFDVETNLLLHEIHKDYMYGDNEFEILYEYDANKNLIKLETRKLSGQLLEFHFNKYDDKNRLIEENGITNGSFNAIYGNYINGNEFHFIHTYEE